MLRKLLSRFSLSGRFSAEKAGATARADQLVEEGQRLEDEGKVGEAFERYRQALEAAPDYAKAHLNLGIALEAMGKEEAAAQSYEAALAGDPANAFASYNLGKLLYGRGAFDQAEHRLRAALMCKPAFPEAHVVLSNVHDARGELAAAARELELALEQRPDYAGALYNLGMVLGNMGRLPEAEAALRRLLGVDSSYPQAEYRLALLLSGRGAQQEAVQLLCSTLARDPDSVEAHAALYEIYNARGEIGAAVAELEAALKQRPDWVDALYNYGMLLKKLWRLPEAEAAFRRVIEIEPKHHAACRMLGGVLLRQSRVDEALDLYKAYRESDPGNFDVDSAKIFVLNFSESISPAELFDAHRAYGVRLESSYPARFESFRNVRNPERRLRIGYVSGDFSSHPVALFLIPLLEAHDRSAYEIFCYSVNARTDEIGQRIKDLANAWRGASSLSSTELADAIHDDAIDVLIDLSGHTGTPALDVFAQQPAPVQATWLGYMNTTGLTRMHYRLCDAYTDPPGAAERLHTERLIRLQHTQWCYRPLISVDPVQSPPCERNGFVTFGSFNQVSKLSRSARVLWARILAQVPGSRLIVARMHQGLAMENFLSDMQSAGIAADRILFAPHVALDEYFRRYNDVDIGLDTMPYSGCTTTCDTLWMGVPVITMAGFSSVSRSTGSILSTVGLPECIALSADDYVRNVVDLAFDRQRLAGLRKSLRQRLCASPLMDEPRFARDMETAYRDMWRAWCDGVR